MTNSGEATIIGGSATTSNRTTPRAAKIGAAATTASARCAHVVGYVTAAAMYTAMSGVAMHSCVTSRAPRGVDSTLPLAVAATPINVSTTAAARAMNAAMRSTSTLSRYSGDAAVNTTSNTVDNSANRGNNARAARPVGCSRV